LPQQCAERAWRAHLALAFARRDERTMLARREHVGPLRVQKPLYPERDVCQCILVHPPGGIAGGDTIALDVRVDPGARAQVTTPGAAKWYRSAGPQAHQSASFDVGEGAVLEWLPQGTIVFDGARANVATSVRLARGAIFVGWEVVCLGRIAAGERFQSGELRHRIDIERDGAPIWSERARLRAGSPLMYSAVGLNGAPVFGTFLTAAEAIDDALVSELRAERPERGEGAATSLPGVLAARYVGDSYEQALGYFARLWRIVRPRVLGREALAPRIWTT
jgi:urease accessory protein